MSSDAQGQALSAAVSSFQIGNRTWKIGGLIHSISTKVFEKEKWSKLSANKVQQTATA
jgi:hypothetical protein